MEPLSLPDQYEIRELKSDEFGALWEKYSRDIFEDSSQVFRPQDILSPSDREKTKNLRSRMGEVYRLNLGLYHAQEFVGWSWGFQESAETFYMCNSAVLPGHRKKGLYTALLTAMVQEVTQLGFQRIYSRHRATNNAVLIPKLKAGFVLTSLEVSDAFGTMVHLTYFSHPLRRKILDYRVGQIQPDQEIAQWLGFKI